MGLCGRHMLCLLAAGALYATRGQNNGTNAQNATSSTSSKDAPRHWRSVLLSTVDTTDAATGDAIVFGGPLTLTEVCQMHVGKEWDSSIVSQCCLVGVQGAANYALSWHMNNALSLLLTWVNGKGGIRVRNETRRLEIISVDDGAPRAAHRIVPCTH